MLSSSLVKLHLTQLDGSEASVVPDIASVVKHNVQFLLITLTMNLHTLLGAGPSFSYKTAINLSFKVDFFCFGVSHNHSGKSSRASPCNGAGNEVNSLHKMYKGRNEGRSTSCHNPHTTLCSLHNFYIFQVFSCSSSKLKNLIIKRVRFTLLIKHWITSGTFPDSSYMRNHRFSRIIFDFFSHFEPRELPGFILHPVNYK